ncbi:MAG: hypothetical protein U5L96_02855 [Owenweeksia sp.]|nr:hypothetical protein [Owenweeksia sp.]
MKGGKGDGIKPVALYRKADHHTDNAELSEPEKPFVNGFCAFFLAQEMIEKE